MNRRLLSMIVNNHPGVLSRVSGLFTRRGYNIDSLTVSTTQDPAFSRITVAVAADESTLEQVVKQLEKLVDVKVVSVLDRAPVTEREIALVKVRKHSDLAFMDAINAAHAAVVDMGADTVTVEVIGSLHRIDRFIGEMVPFGITELARTGLVALSRGDKPLQQQLKGGI